MDTRRFLGCLQSACMAVGATLFALPEAGWTAEGEMGTGVPNFGVYSEATGARIIVWSLSEAITPFPSGCTMLLLTPSTMGWDTYKIAVATLTSAQAVHRKIRFYAHAPRDGGCGVDYVQFESE